VTREFTESELNVISLLDQDIESYPMDVNVFEELENQQGWNNYLNIIRNFVDFPSDSTLLEIAPGSNAWVDIIDDSNIKKYIAVEPHTEWFLNIKEHNSKIEREVYNLTYEQYTPKENIDVLITAGLFYHLASPVHYIETIANVYKPKIVYVETVGGFNPTDIIALAKKKDNTIFDNEKINTPGNRITGNERSVPYSLKLPPALISYFFETVGYELLALQQIRTTAQSKRQCTIFKFSRVGE